MPHQKPDKQKPAPYRGLMRVIKDAIKKAIEQLAETRRQAIG